MRHITTQQPVVDAANHIADAIKHHLSRDERVLWLLSGGSGAAIAVAVSQRLAGVDLHNLSITMTDERYGPIGHADENWQQIINAGFTAPGATTYRPLTGADCLSTAAAWDAWLSAQLNETHYSIGVFGIGSDGHTAGIKPHTSATHSTQLVDAFAGSDYQRLTITFPVISRLSEAVIQASGDDKSAIIHQLTKSHASLDDMPAKILTTLAASTLYTTVQQEESL